MKKKSSTKDLRLSSNERLFLKNKSIFAPLNYSYFKPKGLKIYTFHAGFKKKFEDLLVIIFDKPIKNSIVYSKTSMPSAPIIWDKKHNKGTTRALIVNSGNANAHTGKKGIDLIDRYVKYLSLLINCRKNEILVSSTGVIGELFNPNLIINQLSRLNKKKCTNIFDAAKAIMTTDTYPKISVKNVILDNSRFKIYGIAKGSGMIQPNMGTM
ncbi:bifunctional ornithine acetyltransferase/N-acetylglutamate synthase, partial [Pelagibacteraceae bacterium]|nr:bifunctional ornithine acetyltransferase/N-acetylglutamate synthase [Pelagibacteraceae bacterium]